MFHESIIQPNVVASQQLIVVYDAGSITTMSSNEKQAFAERMNQVADLLNIPDKGRQTHLGKRFKVSQESARKWLQGEGFPSTDKCIEIAKAANVRFEWFMTGRGEKPLYSNGHQQTHAVTEPDSPGYLQLSDEERALLDLSAQIRGEVKDAWFNIGTLLSKYVPERRQEDIGHKPDRRKERWEPDMQARSKAEDRRRNVK